MCLIDEEKSLVKNHIEKKLYPEEIYDLLSIPAIRPPPPTGMTTASRSGTYRQTFLNIKYAFFQFYFIEYSKTLPITFINQLWRFSVFCLKTPEPHPTPPTFIKLNLLV